MTARPPNLRVDRTARLFGPEAMERLAAAHVVVLGIGGVGTFAAEALVRAGVGRVTLVDGERIEETNANRQLHALDGEFGKLKAEVMAERLRRACPGARVDAAGVRYGPDTAEALVPPGVSYVIDAMDTVVAKLHVIQRCLDLRVPIVTALGAARRLDPTAIQVTDLCETHTDQLAKDVRKYLRRRHGIPATAPTGVLAVWSVEEPRRTLSMPGDEHGIPGARRPEPGLRRREPKVFGSVAFVTGAFGLAAAAVVVQRIGGVAPRTHRVLSTKEVSRRRKHRPIFPAPSEGSDMATKNFDAVVIGAGPGGYVAAIRLAQLGKKTALVEKEALGGVCLNWGCIPSKALIAAANLVEDVRGASERGIVADVKVDVGKLRAFKDQVVKKLVGGVGQLEKGNGVEVVRGTARFVAPNAVEVRGADGEPLRLEAPAFIVATGASTIQIPGFAYDGKDVWSAKEAVDLPEIPKRLVCIGGGVIGMELGTVYAKLGSKVTFVEALPQILTGIDVDAVRLVQKGIRQRGGTVLVDAKAKGFERRGGELVVQVEAGGKAQEIACDKILVAVGFKPSIEGLGLAEVGVKVGPKGYPELDAQYRTSVPSIFVIGDLAGPPFLAHKASKEGEIAAEVIAGMKSARDWVALPGAIFTDPEIGMVGLSEEEAKAQGYDPIVGKFAFGALGRAMAIDHTEGFVKVVGDRSSKLLLGATMCGPEAADLVAEPALALEMGAYLEDVALTIHAHPTLPEAFMEACKAALGEAIHALNRPERPRKAEAGSPARA